MTRITRTIKLTKVRYMAYDPVGRDVEEKEALIPGNDIRDLESLRKLHDETAVELIETKVIEQVRRMSLRTFINVSELIIEREVEGGEE